MDHRRYLSTKPHEDPKFFERLMIPAGSPSIITPLYFTPLWQDQSWDYLNTPERPEYENMGMDPPQWKC